MRHYQQLESNDTTESRGVADVLHNTGIAWLILFLSALITLAAYILSERFITARIEDRFIFESKEIETRIEARLIDQYLVLGSGVALFKASEEVSREEWRRFVEVLRLEENYPGLLGFGYAELVTPEKKLAHIERIRAEGFPEYDIKPSGERTRYTPVTYLEPFTWRNQRAFGYDMYSEQNRRTALSQSLETGEMRISGRVTLVQETQEDVQHGFLMYLPLYELDEGQVFDPDLVQGFVYSPFRMRDLMQGVLGAQERGIGFAITDVTELAPGSSAKNGPVTSNVSLGQIIERELNGIPEQQLQGDILYLSDKPESLQHLAELMNGADFVRTSAVEFGGRLWRLDYYSSKAFAAGFEQNQPMIVAIAGGIIDILLFAVLMSLAQQKKKAFKVARSMTRESLKNLHHLQTIVNTVDQGLITTDSQGIITSCNPAITALFLYQPNELKGYSAHQLLGDINEGSFRHYFDSLKNADLKGLPDKIEVQGVRADGSHFPAELSIKPIYNQAGHSLLWVVRELSEQKRAEQAQNEFISTISHELRTPLTSINAAVRLVHATAAERLNQEQTEMLQVAITNCETLSKLVEDILDIEKLSSQNISLSMEFHELSELLSEAARINQQYVDKFDSRLELEQEMSQASVKVDKLRFLQVMANLLSNAAKFSPPRSVIQVHTSIQGSMVRIEVIDEGDGIDGGFLDELFKRFAQADSSDTRSHGGSGLGLYISRKLISAMNGEIGYEKGPQGGACFYVLLPVYRVKEI